MATAKNFFNEDELISLLERLTIKMDELESRKLNLKGKKIQINENKINNLKYLHNLLGSNTPRDPTELSQELVNIKQKLAPYKSKNLFTSGTSLDKSTYHLVCQIEQKFLAAQTKLTAPQRPPATTRPAISSRHSAAGSRTKPSFSFSRMLYNLKNKLMGYKHDA